MRLVCPNCGSNYEVDASLFPEEGREVQCSNCEEVWVQYPVTAEAPMRLDTMAAAPSPRARMDEDERDALDRAVQDEVSARRRQTSRPQGEPEEDEIIAALRSQIRADEKPKKAKGEKAEKGEQPRSAKRDIRKAAADAGVSVDEVDEGPRRWNLPDRDKEPVEQQGFGRRGDGLAAALQNYEKEAAMSQRRSGGGGFRFGFVLVVLVAIIGSGVFVFQEEIAEAYPPAAPYLEQFDTRVQETRVQAEEMFVEYGALARAQIEELTAEGAGDEAETTE